MSADVSKAPVKFTPGIGFEFDSIDGMFRAAECYLQSGFAPSSFKTPQQLVICWARGAELGLRPLQALDGMAVINNRIGIMGDLALAMVRQTGQLVKYEKEWSGEGDTLMCTVTLQRDGHEEHEYTFSVREAKIAGIYGRNPVWPAYPKRMTYYRALGFGLRDEFSDVLKGLYTTEELEDMEHMRADREPEVPPLKIVDADQETAKQEAPPLERQLRQEHPEAAIRPQPQATVRPEATVQPAGSTSTATAAPSASTNHQGVDDLDMGPSSLQGPTPSNPPWWVEHEIKGIKSFLGRTVGSLTLAELQLIESKWIPAAHQQLAKATQEQLDDLKALEERIAHDKVAKPW